MRKTNVLNVSSTCLWALWKHVKCLLKTFDFCGFTLNKQMSVPLAVRVGSHEEVENHDALRARRSQEWVYAASSGEQYV